MLEKSPKWEVLTEVMEEIEKENKNSQNEPGQRCTFQCLHGRSFYDPFKKILEYILLHHIFVAIYYVSVACYYLKGVFVFF